MVSSVSATFWYLGLEPLNARYTEQLCMRWVPAAFARANRRFDPPWSFVPVPVPPEDREIKVGKVLDAVGRGRVSMLQMCAMLAAVERGSVRTGDVIYLQDFWTPGLEALLYALHLHGVKPRIYGRCFAQSVDEYDFTYPMRLWMRPVELGWAAAMDGMFVASEVHREQLRSAGFACPIHVTGLPFSEADVPTAGPAADRLDRVMSTSRLDAEKNPWFMLDVARAFLSEHPSWRWTVTTGAKEFRTDVPGLLSACRGLTEETGGRFEMATVSKAEYYEMLRSARVQFNCALQDYVSFTMLEAAAAGCDLCYPRWRSFPECVHESRLYRPFVLGDALRVLHECVRSPRTWPRAPLVCADGLVVEMSIMLLGRTREVNVWHLPTSQLSAEGLL